MTYFLNVSKNQVTIHQPNLSLCSHTVKHLPATILNCGQSLMFSFIHGDREHVYVRDVRRNLEERGRPLAVYHDSCRKRKKLNQLVKDVTDLDSKLLRIVASSIVSYYWDHKGHLKTRNWKRCVIKTFPGKRFDDKAFSVSWLSGSLSENEIKLC